MKYTNVEDFMMKTNIEVYMTVILETTSNEFSFIKDKTKDKFNITIKFQEQLDQVQNLYFIFENEYNEKKSLEILLGIQHFLNIYLKPELSNIPN